MRDQMKRTRIIRHALFTLLLTGILLSMPVQSFAKSKKAKAAIKAYKSMLESAKIYVIPYHTWFEGDELYLNFCWQKDVSFCLAYVDNNSVPELFLKGHASGKCKCAALFGYQDGYVVRLGFEQVEADDLWKTIKGYYKKKGVIRPVGQDSGEYVVKYRSGSISDYGYHYKKWYYWKGSNKNSKSRFNTKLRKLTGGRKMTKVKWHANTERNRKKYLK